MPGPFETKWGFSLEDLTQRPALEEALERVLLDFERRHEYFADLRGLLPEGRFPSIEPLEDAREVEVVQRGLGVLEPHELAALAQNPVALCQLSEAIFEAMPESWEEVFRRVAGDMGVGPAPAIVDATPGDSAPAVAATAAPVRIPFSTVAPVATPLGGGDQTWEIPPEKCRWLEGDPSLATEPAKIALQWQPPETLRVVIGGFLKPGRQAQWEVVWFDASGEEIARGRPDSPFAAAANLRVPDQQPPQPGHRLMVRHTWRPDDGASWDVELGVTLA